jgi:hypothetical protein
MDNIAIGFIIGCILGQALVFGVLLFKDWLETRK